MTATPPPATASSSTAPSQVDLGDEVAVTGGASEHFGQTQITSTRGRRGLRRRHGRGPAGPAALSTCPPTDAEREPVEGMLVEPVDTLTVSEVFALTSYGELTLSEGGLLVQPTELARPGAGGRGGRRARTSLRRILLDDGVDAPDRARPTAPVPVAGHPGPGR